MEQLPQDVFRKILACLSSKERAGICRVNKYWEREAIAVSQLLAVIPRVYTTGYRATVNEFAVIVESEEYHAFVCQLNHVIRRLDYGSEASSHLFTTACNGFNSDIIIALMFSKKILIKASHLKCIVWKSCYNAVMNCIMKNSRVNPDFKPSRLHIETNTDEDDNAFEICIKYAIKHGLNEIVIFMLARDDGNYEDTEDLLWYACKKKQAEICNILIGFGTSRRKHKFDWCECKK